MDELLSTTEDQLLKSHGFRSKPQMQRLLKYLIKHTYENNEQALQQKAIAIECLGRNNTFVPAKDPIVRIEAARLRKLLEAYYDAASQAPPYKISLPKGSYKVCFSLNGEQPISKGFGVLLVCQSPQHASEALLQLTAKVRYELADRLSRFQHLELMVEYLPQSQIAQKGSVHFLVEKQHDFVLRIEVIEGKNNRCLISSVVIHRVSQEILWSYSTHVSAENNETELAVYYRHLVRSLVGDSLGLLGQHWSNFARTQGLGSVPQHQISWVYQIALANNPNSELAASYLSFLGGRLKQYPEDHVALSGFLFLGFFDYVCDYGLLDFSLEERRTQLAKVVREYPNYDFFPVLLGLYSFALGDYEEAKVHLKTGYQLNPYNACWELLYGGVLFFIGEKDTAFTILEQLKTEAASDLRSPDEYLLTEFLHHVEHGDPLKAFKMVVKVGLNKGQLEGIGEHRSYPNLADYCRELVTAHTVSA